MFSQGCVSGFQTVGAKAGTDQAKRLTVKISGDDRVVLKKITGISEDLLDHGDLFNEPCSIRSVTLEPHRVDCRMLTIGKGTVNEITIPVWVEKVTIARKWSARDEQYTATATIVFGKECSLNDDHKVEWFVGRKDDDGVSVFEMEVSDGAIF